MASSDKLRVSIIKKVKLANGLSRKMLTWEPPEKVVCSAVRKE